VEQKLFRKMKRNELENSVESVERDERIYCKIVFEFMPWFHIYNLLMNQVKVCDSWKFL